MSRESLNIAGQNFLKDIYLNQTIFLTKYITWNQTNQSFLFIQQLDQYSNQPITITINQGYVSNRTSPKYYRISLVNDSDPCQNNKSSGFKANRNLFVYNPCGDNNHRFFAFYQTFVGFKSNLTCDYSKIYKFIKYGMDSSSYSPIPLAFFFTTELNMGACGFLIISNCNPGAYAFAFGLK